MINKSLVSEDPFYLKPGDDVDAIVNCDNKFDTSEFSEIGSGAKYLKVPDAPTDVLVDKDATTIKNIMFSWKEAE